MSEHPISYELYIGCYTGICPSLPLCILCHPDPVVWSLRVSGMRQVLKKERDIPPSNFFSEMAHVETSCCEVNMDGL